MTTKSGIKAGKAEGVAERNERSSEWPCSAAASDHNCASAGIVSAQAGECDSP